MCQLKGKCKSCFHVRVPNLDIRNLYESTDLPRLWEVFLHIIGIGGATKYGFNLMGWQAYALGLDDLGVDVDHNTFWSVMNYFLAEKNNEFMREVRKANGK